MSLFRASAADRFRGCPVCGSTALNAVRRKELGDSRQWWSVRCGQCQAWRTGVLSRRETRELSCWLASDRACMREALARSRWTDLAREFGPNSRSR